MELKELGELCSKFWSDNFDDWVYCLELTQMHGPLKTIGEDIRIENAKSLVLNSK